jgi:membrane protease YdiL (CAAX protease family)
MQPRRAGNSRSGDLAAIVLLGVSNVAINRVAPHPMAITIGVAASAGMLALAADDGATAEDMGLDGRRWWRGLLAGGALAVPVSAAMMLGAAVPATRRFFRDERIVGAHPREALYELAIRMPLATAIAEELMFRSAFESLLARRRTRNAAAVVSAAAFGLWHVLPTLDRVHSNPGVAQTHRGSTQRQALVVAVVTGATAIGSLGLSWLNRRTGSVIAPIVLHYAINASGYAAGWIAARAEDHREIEASGPD